MNDRNKFILDLLAKRNFTKIDLSNLKINNDELSKIISFYLITGCSAIDINHKNIKNIINILFKDDFMKKYKQIKNPIVFSSFYLESFVKKKEFLVEMINNSIAEGAEIIEIHLDSLSLEEVLDTLLIFKECFLDKILSISLSRKNLSNASIIEIIKFARDIVDKRLIIEVDGISSKKNNEDDFNSNLQLLSTADIINKQLIQKEPKFRRIPIILAGGTNSKTCDLATKYGVKYNGINYSNYAYKILPNEFKNSSNNFEFYIKEIDKIRDLLF